MDGTSWSVQGDDQERVGSGGVDLVLVGADRYPEVPECRAGHGGLSFARLRMSLGQLMAAMGRLGGNLPKVAKCLAIPVVKLSMYASLRTM